MNIKSFFGAAVMSAALFIFWGCVEKSPADNSGDVTPSEETPGSEECSLISFSLSGRDIEFECAIDQEQHLVTVKYNSDEEKACLRAARASYEISAGASISPDPAQPLDYTVDGGISLKVTAENGKTSTDYVVKPFMYIPPKVPAKPMVLWIDASANYEKLATKQGIKSYLNKMHESGINGIVVDIKPVEGTTLYDSEFLPKTVTLGGYTIEDRGFDYMQYFIDEARALNMRVTVSTTIMTVGSPQRKSGPAYTDNWWDDKMCVEYLPEGLKDIRETTDSDVFAFANPVHPEVRAYIKRLVQEVATKYDVDGYALDYCRYMNINSDFSDLSRSEFEKWLGQKVENWPEDIYTFQSSSKTDIATGKYYNKWVEWRSYVIQGLVKDIRGWIKDIRPDCDIEYWAASWWPLPHTGQNWASPKLDYTRNYWWANNTEYYKTGFADQLDIFQLGAYLNKVYGPGESGTVEYAINMAQRVIGNDCKIYGTISAASASFDLESAIDLCLQKTSGCMVFDLSHVVRNSKWTAVRKGVNRAWEALGVNDFDNIEIK